MMQQNIGSLRTMRAPLKNLNVNNMKENQDSNHNESNFNYYSEVQDENMNPSQQHSMKLSKSGIDNMDNDNIENMELDHAQNTKNNLYVRRFIKSTAKNSNSICKDNKNGMQKLNVPQLRVDISQCSNSSINESYSAGSINTNYDGLLSSASSLNSSVNGYSASNVDYSHSHSRSYSEIITVQQKEKEKEKEKKKSSLFQKLTNLVTNRNKSTKKHNNNSNNVVDDDGDSQIKDLNNDENENDEEEDDEQLFTPSNGNTPRLITSITPICLSEYNEEIISQIIGTDTFYNDYLMELFNEEIKDKYVWYNASSSYLSNKKRRLEIDWICNTGIDFRLQRSTIFRCIYYFDKLCSSKQINVIHLRMIAATCLLIAIKWNEKEEKVPSLSMLSKLCNKKYSSHSFKPMEVKILNLLNFRLKIVLPIDFVSYYIDNGSIFEDDILDGHKNLHLHSQSKIYLEKFAIFFLDVTYQYYEFYNYKPSVLAMTIIVAARRALKIKPYFNKKLIKLCHYYPKQINKSFQHLWNLYHTKFPSDAQRAENVQPHSLLQLINNDISPQQQSRHTF